MYPRPRPNLCRALEAHGGHKSKRSRAWPQHIICRRDGPNTASRVRLRGTLRTRPAHIAPAMDDCIDQEAESRSGPPRGSARSSKFGFTVPGERGRWRERARRGSAADRVSRPIVACRRAHRFRAWPSPSLRHMNGTWSESSRLRRLDARRIDKGHHIVQHHGHGLDQLRAPVGPSRRRRMAQIPLLRGVPRRERVP